MYHVMNRGERREDVFQDDEDRQHILSTLGEACRTTGWHVYRTQIKGTHRDGMGREADREAMDMPPLTGLDHPQDAPSINMPPLAGLDRSQHTPGL